MVIPKEQNYVTFYRDARKQGIICKSRFKGVTAVRRGNKFYWQAFYYKDRIKKFVGYFEFTYEGEVAANEAVLKAKNILHNS